jgi:hypothetical protein
MKRLPDRKPFGYWKKGDHFGMFLCIPLGWWKSTNYRMEFLATTRGWHFHYLLVVWDRKKGQGWRRQRQLKAVPLTYWEYK